MEKGRKPFTKDKIRGICANVNCSNKQKKSSLSKYGFQKWCSLCAPCQKKKYNQGPWKYRKHKEEFCERCGFYGEKCQLDVHHRDGNHKNNDITNLGTLCANCHRLQHFKTI